MEETIPCAGFEGRIIGKGGATINKLHAETGAKITMGTGSGVGSAMGKCVVSGSTAQVAAAVAAIRRVMEEGDNGGGGGGGGRVMEQAHAAAAPQQRQGLVHTRSHLFTLVHACKPRLSCFNLVTTAESDHVNCRSSLKSSEINANTV
jgi:polyribonucleotide nucleotidyltransferase